ncbi:MAG: hypothetical protein IKY69_02545 [Bacteroidaceae bacterium]|nr:hypothetical protein [Bacteroidaceae bacterium]
MKKLVFAAIGFLLLQCCPVKDIKIHWHEETQRFVTPGVYARIKKVQQRHALVYNAGSAALIRFSEDKCESCDSPMKVAEEDGYTFTNCELLELSSGKLLYMWNARPHLGTGLPYKIMFATSDDSGSSWSSARDLYIADSNFKNGCWEPVAMQLPDGEIEIYFANEAPYANSDEQEISLMRSCDECATWTEAEKVSFRKGFRDGMPSPIYLPHNREIAVAIEDNGIRGRFKPVIVRTSSNWADGCVSADDSRREEALCDSCSLPKNIYAGAPYLINLGESHTLLSIQSTEGRKGENERYANMQVYVGDKDARNFGSRSTPLPDLPENAQALWNSITMLDGNTIIAIMSVHGYKKNQNGIWTIKGKIERVK